MLRTLARTRSISTLNLARMRPIPHVIRTFQPLHRYSSTPDDLNLFAQAAEAKQKDARKEEQLRRMKEAAEKEEKQKRAASTRTNLAIFGSLLVSLYAYLGIESTESPNKEGENQFEAHQRRVNEQLLQVWKFFMEPPSEKLLPDPLPPQYQPPYTLLVELNDSLVHLVWDKTVGWRAAIRPGARDFLEALSRYFEVVIFTTSPGHLAQPVIAALDPYSSAMYRLYRDHTKYEKNVYIKDISKLNRDPSKVIILDVNPECYQKQPENGLKLPAWHGELDDDQMDRFSSFLEEFAVMMMLSGAKDVRPFLKLFNSIDDQDTPKAWVQQKETWRKDFASLESKGSSPNPGVLTKIGSFVGQLLGNKTGDSLGIMNTKKTQNLIDSVEHITQEERANSKREHAARKAEQAKRLLEMEEMVKAQMEENKAKKLKLLDYFMGAGQPVQPKPE